MKNVLKTLGLYGARLLAALRRNWGYKLLALIFAVILWASVMSTVNPEKNKTFDNIPIHIENLDVLQDKGMTLLKSVDYYSAQITADVVLGLTWNTYSSVSESAITLTADLSKITETGEQSVRIVAQTANGRIVSCSPDTIKVTVEDYISRPVPVEIDKEGTLADGYWQGTETKDPVKLRIQGPRSLVETVVRASVPLSLDGITADYSASLPFVLLDKDDQPVDGSAMEFSDDYVIVSLPVRPTKTVPVLAREAVVGADDLPDGYEMTKVEIYPETVTVAAPQSVLDAITGISIPTINVSDATQDVTGTVTLTVPEGAQLLDEETAEFIVRIEEIETTLDFENVPIAVRGLGDDLEASLVEQQASVKVTGPAKALSGLLGSAVKLYVDASNLEPGVYTLEVLADINDRYRVRETQIDPGTIDVTITEP